MLDIDKFDMFKKIFRMVQNHSTDINFSYEHEFVYKFESYNISIIFERENIPKYGGITRGLNFSLVQNLNIAGRRKANKIFDVYYYLNEDIDRPSLSTVRLCNENTLSYFVKGGKEEIKILQHNELGSERVILHHPLMEEEIFMKSTIIDVPEMEYLDYVYTQAKTFFSDPYGLACINIHNSTIPESFDFVNTLEYAVMDCMNAIREKQDTIKRQSTVC